MLKEGQNPAESDVDPRFEIQKTTIEDALGRAIYEDKQGEYKKLLQEKPGYYAFRQSLARIERDPASEKVIPDSFTRKEIKEGYCWLGVDIGDYFAEYERCIDDPNRIFELAKHIHPSMLEYHRKRGREPRELSREDLIRNFLGIEQDFNPWISFAYECTAEDEEKFFEDLFADRGIKKDDHTRTTSLVKTDSELKIPFYPAEGQVDYKSAFKAEANGIGAIGLWPPPGLSEIGIENTERFKKILGDIKTLVDKLKGSPQVSQIYLGLGTPLVPFWKRPEQ